MHDLVVCEPLGRKDHLENGGDRRSAQISEILQRAGIEHCDIQFPEVGAKPLRQYLAGIRFAREVGLLHRLSRDRLWSWGLQRARYESAFETVTGARVFLWEKTRWLMGAYVAKARGMKIVALPHNLESLVPGNKDKLTGDGLPRSLELEKQRLAFADAIFCISKEEQWLLQNLGQHADYLPYYPPDRETRRFLSIRERRATSARKHILIIGSAVNNPTRIGMEALLKALRNLGGGNTRFEVVGRGTEVLRELCDDARLVLRGGVDDDTLNQLLVESKMALVYQESGAGALTRIPELLIAGIPVMGNSIACRSVSNLDGVTVFESWNELSDLLRITPKLPQVPELPRNAGNRLVESVSALAA